MNTSSISLTAKLDPNGVGTGGLLTHGQPAYVPLSNESQLYGQENNGTVQDMNYKDNAGNLLSIANDKFLLPVQVNGTPNAQYFFGFDQSGVRLWAGSDRTGQILANTGSVQLNSKGTATFYVEGIKNGSFTIKLLANANGANALDNLTVNVFSFNGPENVPNYGSYSYSVTGGTGCSPATTGRYAPSAPTGATNTKGKSRRLPTTIPRRSNGDKAAQTASAKSPTRSTRTTPGPTMSTWSASL